MVEVGQKMSDEHLKIANSWKKFTSVFTVLFTIFTWRQMTILITDSFLNVSVQYEGNIVNFGIYYLTTALFILVSPVLLKKLKRNFYISVWATLATISSLVLLFGGSNVKTEFFLFFAGASVGVGIPACLTYFADNTHTENRGRVGAVIFFFITLTFVVLAVMLDVLKIQNFIYLSFFWAIISLILTIFLRLKKQDTKEIKIYLNSIISNKKFLLYFIPWLMFCFIDAFEAPILQVFIKQNFGNDFRDFLLLILTSITTFAILVTGFLIDYYGRKRILLYGFILLGIAHGVVGVASQSVFSWYLYALVDGFALGVFIVTFVFTIWGDLSSAENREEYYALGTIPFFVVQYIQKLIAPYILKIPISAAFSFASFFLFLAVWPLFNAPETLPERKVRERELRKYIEKAKKIREKYS